MGQVPVTPPPPPPEWKPIEIVQEFRHAPARPAPLEPQTLGGEIKMAGPVLFLFFGLVGCVVLIVVLKRATAADEIPPWKTGTRARVYQVGEAIILNTRRGSDDVWRVSIRYIDKNGVAHETEVLEHEIDYPPSWSTVQERPRIIRVERE